MNPSSRVSSTLPRRAFIGEMVGYSAVAIVADLSSSALAFTANDTVNVACIGTGGRCRHLMKALVKVPGVKIVGVCDIWDEHLRQGKELADKDAFQTKNFHEVLQRKDVDAVLIGAPDHWHVPLTIAACQAGKDVYVEKPLTHELSEGAAVIDAQNRHKRVVQVGMQQRSMPHIIKAREIVKSGVLGDIHKVHLTWNRNAPRANKPNLNIDPKSVDWKMFLGSAKNQPFDEYKFRQWRWFWDFGGGIFTDLMVHWIDVVHWLLELDHPEYAVSIGDWYMAEGIWETPDTVQTLLRYPKQQAQIYFEGTFSNARNGSMVEFMGTNGTLYIDRGRYEIHPERNKKLEPSEMVLGTGPRGADFYDKPDGELVHLTNWIDCIRSRQKPTAPAEAGVSAAAAAHLANMALRANQAAKWK